MTNDSQSGFDSQSELVVPVIREEAHVDAVPVETGGVRVVKRVESHEEILEQELRRGRVEVKRVKTDRVVDGPQEALRVGNTLVIPVVSEVLRVTKEWVVTEEIHVTQVEEVERVQSRVRLNHETAEVERFHTAERTPLQTADTPQTTKDSGFFQSSSAGRTEDPLARRILSDTPMIIRDRVNRED